MLRRGCFAQDELAAAGGQVSVALTTRLRKDLSAERAHLVLEQIDLRQRAREKFTRAERMFFTRKGLEQATDEPMARYKAARFPIENVSIYDLCCGIGGDLIALAQGRTVRGVDSDPVCGLLADRNLAAYGADDPIGLRIRVEDFVHALESVGSTACVAWHLDPDRRVVGKRTTNMESFSPPLPIIAKLLALSPNGAIKIAPASEVPPQWQSSAEREWIGSRGECRQQVVWHGDLALRPGRRSATVVDAAGGAATIVGAGDEPLPVAAALGRYLYEPHAAVLAAHLAGVLCGQHGLTAIAPEIAYLTSDRLIQEPLLDAFEVLDVLPLDRKQLKAYCRERGLGRLEIKKRGVAVEPEKLRQEIAAAGEARRRSSSPRWRDRPRRLSPAGSGHKSHQPAAGQIGRENAVQAGPVAGALLRRPDSRCEPLPPSSPANRCGSNRQPGRGLELASPAAGGAHRAPAGPRTPLHAPSPVAIASNLASLVSGKTPARSASTSSTTACRSRPARSCEALMTTW